MIIDLEKLLKEYYAIEGNGNGGNLHIVTEDQNIDDSHILFCFQEAKKQKDRKGQLLAGIFLGLSKTQRLKFANKSYYPEI